MYSNLQNHLLIMRSYALSADNWFMLQVAETDCEITGRDVTWLW